MIGLASIEGGWEGVNEWSEERGCGFDLFQVSYVWESVMCVNKFLFFGSN